MDNKKITNTAIRAAKTAGKMLISEYERFKRADVRLKSHHEIVTRADLLSEEIIIKTIKSVFPGHGILSEELGRAGPESDWLWVIDPIDGTTNFTMHNPLWAVSIAVAYREEIVAGVIYAPALDELYSAEAGQGAMLNGKKIAVSKVHSGKVLNTFCHGSAPADIRRALGYYRRQKLSGFDCRQLGSAALELAYIAAGRVESFVAPGTKDWDVAAGALLAREAGGLVTDFRGRPWRLGVRDILAANRLVHRDILRTVKGI